MTVRTDTAVERASVVPRPRLAYMDNLRILLTALVVLHHAAVTYGNVPLWFYVEPAEDPTGAALDVLVILNQTFFMGFFFMIAGFFVPASFDTKGARAFLRGRLVRLGIPLLLTLLLLRPAFNYWVYLTHVQGEIPYWLFYIVSWDPGPMWFVEVLLVFCLGYALVRRWRRVPAPEQELGAVAGETPKDGGRLPGPLWIVGFTAGLTVITLAWRVIVPDGSFWPFIGLPTPAFLPQYLSLFIVGVYAYRRGWFTSFPRSTVWVSGIVTVLLAVTRLNTMVTPFDDESSVGATVLSVAVECAFAVSIILFLTSLFHRLLNHQNTVARSLSDNAFGVYFLHPLFVVGVAWAMAGWSAPALAKFAALAAIALPVTWGAAWLMRTLPAARRVF